MTTDADVTQADREMLATAARLARMDDESIALIRRAGCSWLVASAVALRAIAAARIAATPKPKMPCGVPGGCDDSERCVSEGECHYGWSSTTPEAHRKFTARGDRITSDTTLDPDRVATVVGILERARNIFRVNDSEYQEWEINKLARQIIAVTAADTAPPVAPAPNEANATPPAFTAEMSELLSCLAREVRWMLERHGGTRAITVGFATERAFPTKPPEAGYETILATQGKAP